MSPCSPPRSTSAGAARPTAGDRLGPRRRRRDRRTRGRAGPGAARPGLHRRRAARVRRPRDGCQPAGQRGASPGRAGRPRPGAGQRRTRATTGVPQRSRTAAVRRGRRTASGATWGGRSVCATATCSTPSPCPRAATLEHAQAVAARPTPAGVEVELEGAPSPRHFDFVIGADGVHSSMREAIAVDGLRPSSMTGSSWRFVADNPGVDCWTAWSGRDETFLLIPVEEGRVYGYAARTRGGDAGLRPAPGWRRRPRGFRRRWAPPSLKHSRAVSCTMAASTRCGWSGGTTGGSCSSVTPRTRPGRCGRRAWRWPSRTRWSSVSCWRGTPAEHWTGVGAEFERLRRPRVEHVQAATDKMSRLAALPGWLRDVSAPILGPRNYRAAYAPLRNVPSNPVLDSHLARILARFNGANVDGDTLRPEDHVPACAGSGDAEGPQPESYIETRRACCRRCRCSGP